MSIRQRSDPRGPRGGATIARAAGVLVLLLTGRCHPAPPEPQMPVFKADSPALLPREGLREPSIVEMRGVSYASAFLLDHVEEDPAGYPSGSAAIADAPDFFFAFGQGSGWHGYDVLRVDAAGQAEIEFGGQATSRWRRAVFQLSPAELGALRQELVAIDVFAMKRVYSGNVDDGTQWFLKVRAGGQRKAVLFDNHFPESVQRLSTFVRARILVPHRAELERAPERKAARGHLERERW